MWRLMLKRTAVSYDDCCSVRYLDSARCEETKVHRKDPNHSLLELHTYIQKRSKYMVRITQIDGTPLKPIRLGRNGSFFGKRPLM